jgi:hypothetical protein
MANFDELRAYFEQDEHYDFETWESDNLYELEQKVYDKYNIWIEPSVQCGQGGIWIYSNDNNEPLIEGYDYQTFIQEVRNIAMLSNTDEEFIDGFDKYIERILDL